MLHTFYVLNFSSYLILITFQYGLIIDAGSTHSQLFVFSWTKNENQKTGDVNLIHNCIMPSKLDVKLVG